MKYTSLKKKVKQRRVWAKPVKLIIGKKDKLNDRAARSSILRKELEREFENL